MLRLVRLVTTVATAHGLSLVRRGELKIFSTRGCPFCVRAKKAVEAQGLAYTNIDLGEDVASRGQLGELVGAGFTVPQIFVGETKVGGADDLEIAMASGEFGELVRREKIEERSYSAEKKEEGQIDVVKLAQPGSPLNVLVDEAHLRSLVDEQGSEDVARDVQGRCLDLLEAHVTDDGVDYAALRTSPKMAAFVLATTRLASLKEAELLDDAFWINVYNALVMHAQVVYGMGPSADDRAAFFGGAGKYNVCGFDLSLDDIEHGVLRRSPKGDDRAFSEEDPRCLLVKGSNLDPRLHFALNCGAKSCPPVKIFSAKNLNDELQTAAAAFLTSTTSVDAAEVELSRLFLWYGKDFASTDADLLKKLATYVKGTQLGEDLTKAAEQKFIITHAPYDWERNDA